MTDFVKQNFTEENVPGKQFCALVGLLCSLLASCSYRRGTKYSANETSVGFTTGQYYGAFTSYGLPLIVVGLVAFGASFLLRGDLTD